MPAVAAGRPAAAAPASQPAAKDESSPPAAEKPKRSWASLVSGDKGASPAVSGGSSADQAKKPGSADAVAAPQDGKAGSVAEAPSDGSAPGGAAGGDGRTRSRKSSADLFVPPTSSSYQEAQTEKPAAAFWDRESPEEAMLRNIQQGSLWHPPAQDVNMAEVFAAQGAMGSPYSHSLMWSIPPMQASPDAKPASTITTSGIPLDLDADTLAGIMEAWGLNGTHDFVWVPMQPKGQLNEGYAIIHFIDAAFANLFSWMIQQSHLAASVVTWAEVQGFQAAKQLWVESCLQNAKEFRVTAEEGVQGLGFRPTALPPERMYMDSVEPGSWAAKAGIVMGDEMVMVNDFKVVDMTAEQLGMCKSERPIHLKFVRHEVTSQPKVDAKPVPSQWAVNSVNTMLSERYNAQFYKTKPCMFFSQSRCERGANCPFAHSEAELQPVPNLARTKLCYNYFRNRCNTRNCKFAHGSRELRSAWEGNQNNMGMGYVNAWGVGMEASGLEALATSAPGTWMVGSGDQNVQASSSESEAGSRPQPIVKASRGTVFTAEDLAAAAAAREAADMVSAMAGIVCCRLGQVALVEETLHRLAVEKRKKRTEAASSAAADDDDSTSDSEGADGGPTLRRSWTDGDLAAIGNALEASSWV